MDGERTLLSATLSRALRVTSIDRIVPVVAAHHERWWRHELGAAFLDNAVVQPFNRGTAAGILVPVLGILERDPDAIVVTMPSDHTIEAEDTLVASVVRAVAEIDQRHLPIVVLGVETVRPEEEYGWIVPCAGPRSCPCRVSAFREKPDVCVAKSLLDRGALVNTMIVAAEGRCLLALFKTEAPQLWQPVEKVIAEGAIRFGPGSGIAELYRTIPQLDFSRDVLQPAGKDLWVYRIPPCGWIDVGTPRRLREHRRRHELSADRCLSGWAMESADPASGSLAGGGA
jgi:mannose-1-phosphate guanylyltransferase